MQLVSGKVEINTCQVSLLQYNSFLVSLWTFQPTLVKSWAPLHKTIVSLQLMVSRQTMVSAIDFLILIGYGAVLLW